MPDTSPKNPGDVVMQQDAHALVVLCKGILPVWARHLATSRAQSEVAVAEMLKAFAEIGPHIDMTERQSRQINDALAQPVDGVMGLVSACEHVFAPELAAPDVPASCRAAMEQVLDMVRSSVGALEDIARPFQHETQLVAAQVERMYMGFQYQDRISQMMVLLEGDLARLQATLDDEKGAAPDVVGWLTHLESQYAMAEQHRNHLADAADPSLPNNDETTFF